MGTQVTEQQTTLADLNTETAPQPKKPQPVQLRTADDYTITTQAIESRVEDLKKLAKKNEEEGYTREASNINADAASLEHFVLPQFRAQQEIPLRPTQQLRGRIMEALRPVIRPKLVVRTNDKEATTSISRREEELAGDIANRVMQFARELFDEAYNAGHAAREQNYETFALRAMGGLFGNDGA